MLEFPTVGPADDNRYLCEHYTFIFKDLSNNEPLDSGRLNVHLSFQGNYGEGSAKVPLTRELIQPDKKLVITMEYDIGTRKWDKCSYDDGEDE